MKSIQLGTPIGESYKAAFKRGWFNGYKTYFLREFKIDFESSPCNLTLIEELILARNRVQHQDSITNQSSYYSDDDIKKIPSPFFIDDRDRQLLAEMTDGASSWLTPPSIHVTDVKLKEAIIEITQFAEWLENNDH